MAGSSLRVVRRAIAVSVAGAVLATLAARPLASPAEARAAQAPTTYRNPLVNGLTANPAILKAPDGFYYAYFDGFDFGTPAVKWSIGIYRSPDLVSWSQLGPAMSFPGATFGGWNTSTGFNFTSPSVGHFPNTADPGQRYVLYFTGMRTTGQRCIGLATAASPGGPFTANEAPLICPTTGGAQDPSLVPVGPLVSVPQLLYTQTGANGGINNHALAPDGLSLGVGPFELFRPPTAADQPGGWWQWQAGAVDRPSAVYKPNGHQDDAAVLFFGAAPRHSGSHGVGQASCKSFGPGGVLYSCATTAQQRGPWMTGTKDAQSPGGVQVFGDGTNHWITYDALPAGSCTASSCNGIRTMRIDKLCIDNGEPRTNAPSVTPQPIARPAACSDDVPQGWVATWAAATAEPLAPVLDVANRTLRQGVHSSIAGSAVRVRLSNTHGTQTLDVAKATIAVSAAPSGASPNVAATPAALTFGGSPSVQIPAGQTVLSDPVALAVPADHDLAVSMHFSTGSSTQTTSLYVAESSYLANVTGDQTGIVTDTTGVFPSSGRTLSSYFLSSVEVLANRPSGTVVVLGDSISDGRFFISADTGTRWSDKLFDRMLAANRTDFGVVNVAQTGNKLLPSTGSGSGLGRLERDVLSQADADTVIVFLGTNDVLHGANAQTGSQFKAGLSELIQRAHAVGIRVVGATIPPLGSHPSGTEYAGAETERQEINTAVLAGQPDALGFDTVVDFNQVLCCSSNPAHPTYLKQVYDPGETGTAHPNTAGHAAMAEAVSLESLLQLTYRNNLVNGLSAQPAMFRSLPPPIGDGQYYAYANGFDIGGTKWNIAVYRSSNLATWSQVGPAMSFPGATFHDWNTGTGFNFTSPSAAYVPEAEEGKRFVLYFTGVRTNGDRCIGVATAATAAGPFTPEANPVVCPPGGAQDPSFVPIPATGLAFQQLLYKKNGSNPGIYNQKLTPNGRSATAESPYLLYTAMPNWWHQGTVDRPSYGSGGPGVGVLFFGAGPPNTAGRAVGWSPCKVTIIVIESCSNQSHLGTWLAGSGQIDSPSGVQVFSDGMNQWISYDALPAGSCPQGPCTSGLRTMRIDKLCFRFGIPRTNGPTFGTDETLVRTPDCSMFIPGRDFAVRPDATGFVDDARLDQPARVMYRDGNASAPINGRVLWTHADTTVCTQPIASCPSNQNHLIIPSTAALGPPAAAATAPTWTTEPTNPSGYPSQFIPDTQAELQWEQANPGKYIGHWPQGVIGLPDGSGMVFSLTMEVTGGGGFVPRGVAAVRVATGSTTANRTASPRACNPTCLFTGTGFQWHFNRPLILGDGFLYLYGDRRFARAPLGGIEDRSQWRFWNGSDWVDDVDQAAQVPNLSGGLSITYNPYLDKFVAVGASPSIGVVDHFSVQTAPNLTGPWTPFSNLGSTQRCGSNGVISGREHSAFMADGGRTLMLTYEKIGAEGTGCNSETRVVTVRLQ